MARSTIAVAVLLTCAMITGCSGLTQRAASTAPLPATQTLTITTTSLPPAQVSQPYSATLQASGGTPTYTWSVTSGQLPSGLLLGVASGQISGTPTAAGQFSFTIQVADSASPPHTATQPFSLSVSSSAAVDPFGGNLAKGCAGGVKADFYVEKINNRWWFCTPAGNAFWMEGIFDIVNDTVTDWLGTNNNTVILAKYGSRSTWVMQVLKRMQSWNFNTVGEQGTYDGLHATSGPSVLLPFTGFLWPMHYSVFNANGYAPGPTHAYPPGIKFSLPALSGINNAFIQGADPFDPNFSAYVLGWLRNDAATKAWYTNANNSYMIGWISDDADSVGFAKAGLDFHTVRNSQLETGHGSSTTHFGYLTLIHAPLQTIDTPGRNQDLNGDQLYTDPQFYVKSELANWLQQTSDNGPGYISIAALNSAWGSSYTTFGTAASSWTDTIGTGNGSQTLFSATLTHSPVSPCGILVKVGGVPESGDDCAGPIAASPSNIGNFHVNVNVGSSTINYLTGAVTVVFSSAPLSGAAITIDYKTGGWGSGNGILDEDGSCPAKGTATCWLPTDAWTLAGSNVTAAFQTDMDHFLYHLAKKYFSTIKAQLNTVDPGRLYLCTTGLGGWGAPARAAVLRAAGQFCDVLSENSIPNGVAPDDQARVNFVTQWGGDKPWIEWLGIEARADSYEGTAGNPNGPTDTIIAHQTTQAARGQVFTNVINTYLNLTDATFNTVHVVGYRFWQFYDSRGEGDNWGLASLRDNAYDGVEACNIAGRVDAWGFPLSPETQLPAGACYGNFISAVQSANRVWLSIP